MERKKFTTNISEELLKESKIYCIKNDMNMNELIEQSLAEFLKKAEKKKKASS